MIRKKGLFLLSLCSMLLARMAYADVFGSGGNTFNIDFVTIGNPGNAADTTGYPNIAGSVPYVYRVGMFEISEQMINKANALGGLGLTKVTFGPDKPASGMSWNEAARFVNWLNASSGSKPAYKFTSQPGESGYSANSNIQDWGPSDAGYNSKNHYRNSLAQYFLPSDDEWYKAAYYDPTSGVYFDYPTGSDTAPAPVASGTMAGTAVYNGQQSGRADVTSAGGLSPYGTLGQGGNVKEWEETSFDFLNGPPTSSRGIRGGDAFSGAGNLSSRFFDYEQPDDNLYGFRVASAAVPEPCGLVLILSAGVVLVSNAARFARPRG
jgi:hypothetical protein